MRPFKYYQPEESDYVRIYFRTLHQRSKAHTLLTGGTFEYISKTVGLRVSPIETASNDKSGTAQQTKQGTVYYRKAAREYKFTLGDWNVLTDYTIDTGDFIRKAMCPYVFRLSVDNFKPLSETNINKQEIPSLKFDKTMVECRDYETYSNKPTGNAPVPENVFDADGNELDVIFMAGLTFHWHFDAKPMLQVTITTMPTPPRPDCLIIQVMDQIDIIKVEALMISKMSPDIITGFNDGLYDNPFMFRRAEEYDAKFNQGIVKWIRKHTSCVTYNEDTEKWLIGGFAKEDRIKIEADQSICNEFINNQGLMSIDCRTVFRQINPTAEESSLNFFLTKYKLDLKEDMEYTTMFRIFHLTNRLIELFDSRDFGAIIARLEALRDEHGPDFKPLTPHGMNQAGLKFKPKGTQQPNGRPWYSHIDEGQNTADNWTVVDQLALLKQSTDVVNYCNVDSTRCMDLLIAGNVIPDKREVAILSYVSLYDCFYRAGGMKVRNLVISIGIKPEWNLAFDNVAIKTAETITKKYPGAYVVPPVKGLFRDHVIVKRKRRMINQGENKENNPAIEKIKPNIVDPSSTEFDKTLTNPHDPRWILDQTRSSSDENEETDRPCTGLDFSSLYPSLIMTYNLSPEKTLRDPSSVPEVYKELLKKYPGRDLKDLIHQSTFRYGEDDEAMEERELIEGKFVRHVPIKTPGPDGKTTYEGMGLYPFILLDLYNQRSAVKKKADRYGCPKEFMEKMKGLNSKDEVKTWLEQEHQRRDQITQQNKGTQKERYFARQADEVKHCMKFMEQEWFALSAPQGQYEMTFDELYKTVCFYFAYYTTKQLALKVFMNTFYGETGNAISPFFIVMVAGAITTSGKDNIHRVKNFVEEQGYRVKYGDTDSLYICCPDRLFQEIDDDYLEARISKLDYWTKMIELTMETIDKFKDDVNTLLANDNGTGFLKMAYEEVLFPFAMVGKKKYIGIKHEGIVNLSACMPDITPEAFMKSRTLFIRGLEIKKRGASQFLKINVYAALRDMFNLQTTQTMCEIFEAKLAEVAVSNFDPEVFVRTAKYKLPAQGKPGNVTVQEFARRMTRLEKEHPEFGIKCPELGERFPYIVARKDPFRYDIRGRKNQIKIGEKYEDYRYFTNQAYANYLGGPIEVDRDYYMMNEISGQFARFVVYHPKYDKFCKDGVDPSLLSDDEYKIADKKAIEFSKKELQNFYKERFAYQYEERGTYYKDLYKQTSQSVLQGLKTKYGSRAHLFKLTQNITTETDDNGEFTYQPNIMRNYITQKFSDEAKKSAKTGMNKKVANFLHKAGGAKKATYLYEMYVSGPTALNKIREKGLKIDIEQTQKKIDIIAKDYQEVCLHNTAIMSKLIDARDTEIRSAVLPLVPAGTISPEELAYYSKFGDLENTPTEEESEEPVPVFDEALEEKANEVLDKMFDLFTKLIGLYKSEIEIKEIQEQLVLMKDTQAGHPVVKPKSVKPKEEIRDIATWLSHGTNWEVKEARPLIVKTSIGEIDLF
jgi:DNA polymerase elongation subunit (family B)